MLNLNKNHHRHPEFISGSTRHCERSEAISSRLPRATALAMTNETGRSMVEMLGVLAVIGVLSITGISGYTTAMNKHRANEILDAASKRAVAVSTQIQRGNTSPTLDEFDTNTVQGVKFEDPATVGTDAKQFRLPLNWTGISDEDQQETLCQYMQQYISEDGTNSTALIDSDCARILYNSDLSVGVSNTNNRDADDSTKCATGYTGADCDSCATNYGLHNGTCVACSTVGATGTISTVLATGYTGCYCTSTQTWENSQCKSAVKNFKILNQKITSNPNNSSACTDLGGSWHLASAQEVGCSSAHSSSCDVSSLNYTSDSLTLSELEASTLLNHEKTLCISGCFDSDYNSVSCSVSGQYFAVIRNGYVDDTYQCAPLCVES